jgi:hypothetical protein
LIAQREDQPTIDPSAKNLNGGERIAPRTTQDNMDEIAALDAQGAKVLHIIRTLL